MNSSSTDAAARMEPSRISRERWVGIALNMAAPPRMNPMLKMLLPTMFPTETSPWPRKAESRVTANSGAEVPRATRVSPMISSETPSRRASREAESTTHWAP